MKELQEVPIKGANIEETFLQNIEQSLRHLRIADVELFLRRL